MEKTKGKARPLHLPSHTAVRKHACQARTQHELMRMGFQFKGFLCARCRREEGSRPTTHWDSAENCQLISTVNWGRRDLPSIYPVSNWPRGSQGCHSDYTDLLFTNTRKKPFPHVCDTYAHLTPAQHHQYAIFTIIHRKVSCSSIHLRDLAFPA